MARFRRKTFSYLMQQINLPLLRKQRHYCRNLIGAGSYIYIYISSFLGKPLEGCMMMLWGHKVPNTGEREQSNFPYFDPGCRPSPFVLHFSLQWFLPKEKSDCWIPIKENFHWIAFTQLETFAVLILPPSCGVLSGSIIKGLVG